MNQLCRVSQDLNNFFIGQEAAERSYAYSRADKQEEVIELADRLIKGLPMRCVKYWATHSLLTFSDVVEEAINHLGFEKASMELCKGDSNLLAEIYRKEAQYMIARALFDKDTAEELGFKP